MTRLMLVDDSALVLRILRSVFDAEEGLEIVGTASNGREALQRLPELNPDLVVLDIEMPVMGGLEALPEIKKRYPRLPVIMFSTLTERGAKATIEALTLGARDYATKPTNSSDLAQAIESVRSDLVGKIRMHAPPAIAPRPPEKNPTIKSKLARMRESRSASSHSKVLRPTPMGGNSSFAPAMHRNPPQPKTFVGSPQVVAVGVSTGGPEALAKIVPAIPGDFPLPILIVQHMPPTFTSLLAKRLDALSALSVREGQDGDAVAPGSIIIAPGGRHMLVARGVSGSVIRLSDDPPVNSCRPAVDVLFDSVGEVFGGRALGVILTGMGHDGLAGAQNLAERGCGILAQDQHSSVVWGMPRAVAEAGICDAIVPLDQIALEIQTHTRRTGPRSSVTAPNPIGTGGGR